MVSSEIHHLDWRHIEVFLVPQVIICKELPMFWLILINNQNENYCIWSTSYSDNTAHRHSLSVRHTGRCFPHTRMTNMNINISYKYSNASHSSPIIWLLFHTLQRKLIERKNWSQIRNLNISPRSLSLKVSCETSRSKVSFFAISPSLPNHITCSPVLRFRRSRLKWCHLHRNPTILEWHHLLQPKRSFFSQIS